MAVYLLHFEKPFYHAQHYVGFSNDYDQRIHAHKTGQGSKLTRAVVAAGIKIEVARLWLDGDMGFERKLHNSHALKQYCPVCDPDAACRYPLGESPRIVGKHDAHKLGRIWICICCDCQLTPQQINSYCPGKGFYANWSKVPIALKTWSQWQSCGRMVKSRQRRVGAVLHYTKGQGQRWIDLYRVDQTVLASEVIR